MDCKDCGLHEYANTNCLRGVGPSPCHVMVIGEAPGYQEDQEGRPFVGKAGKLLRELMTYGGIDIDSIYVTNAVKCRPLDNRAPSQKEIKACSKHLKAEIHKVKPKHIIVLGASSLKALLNKSGISKMRGQTIDKDGISYHLTLHPAGLFRQPQQEPYVRADFARFGKIIRGELETLGDSLRWTLVDTPAKLRKCISSLVKADVVTYDIETPGFSPRAADARLFVLGLAEKDKQWVIPFSYPGSPFNDKGIQRKIIKMLSVALEDTRLIAHNAKFDDKYSKHLFGWCPGHTFDTMLASHLLDENSRHGLKPLSEMFFDAPSYALPQPVDPQQVPLSKLAKYCATDVYYTMKLYEKFKSELLSDKALLRIYKNITIPASQALVDAELEGVYLDPIKYKSALALVQSRVKEALAKLNKLAKTDKVNWNSPAQIALVLFDQLGLSPISYTDTGAPSTAEAVLVELKGEHPIAQAILDYREQVGLLKFLNSWGELMEGGKLYPNFKLHGTITGRLSCADPNLQQVPRDPLLRSILTAPPGWVFVEADYSQIELRIAAAISGDTTMKLAYQTGQDLHRLTASNVLGIPMAEVTSDQRKKAKAVNFGFIYGMGAPKFQEYAKTKYDVTLSLAEAKEFRKRFFDLYPGLVSWHERQRRIVKKFRYVRTPLGRKRRLPEINSPDKAVRAEAERQAINSPVQGMAVDLAMFAFGRIHKELSRSKIWGLGNIHDALLYIVREDCVDEILPLIEYYMTDMETVKEVFGYEMPVPIEIEMKVGPWGQGKVWKN